MKQLLSTQVLAQLNKSHQTAADEVVQHAETPTLGQIYLRQLLIAEKEFLKAVATLQAKYRHAHVLAISASHNPEVDDLLSQNNINKSN